MFGQLCVVLVLLSPVLCHVALKYPPARKYDLDFLDSFRTSGDCGMNPGQEVTMLEAGSQLNVTWHLGYPHGGGYRLELISSGGAKETLVPAGGGPDDWESTEKYAQNHLLQLPTQPCSNCYLRLLRQATEWGQAYQFRSCSDVSLVPAAELTETCGTNGTLVNNRCECDPLYSGDRCQYRSMCDTDADCNGPKGQGSCELINNVIFEEKMCFCNQGFFGEQCEKRNQFEGEEREWRKDEFSSVELGGHMLHWRLQDGDVEIVVEASTLSWVGVGWRPAGETRTCRRFPTEAPAPLGSDFHAMDCTDVVVGVARGGRGAVADFYTRDRSTPRRDSFWGGEDDLTSATAWEENGKTFLRFRKRISTGLADHPFQGKVHFIWATGQTDDFYRADQLKYHGRVQRGVTSLDVPEIGGSRFHIVLLGIIISSAFLLLLFLVQIIQNSDRQCRLFGRKSKTFTPTYIQ